MDSKLILLKHCKSSVYIYCLIFLPHILPHISVFWLFEHTQLKFNETDRIELIEEEYVHKLYLNKINLNF